MKEIHIIVTGNNILSIEEFINCVSDDELHAVNKIWVDKVNSLTTEITMQCNYCQVDEKHRINFFVGTTPSHFDYFESIQPDGFNALVVLADANNLSNIETIEKKINKHKGYLTDFAMILVVTNLTGSNKKIMIQINQMLKSNHWVLPVLEVNPTNITEVSLAIETLLYFKNTIPQKNEMDLNNRPSIT